jgi:hypothetical protein
LDEIVIPRNRRGHFGCGYRMEARFVLREGKTLLRIPNRALFSHENRRAVFVRPMKAGHDYAGRARSTQRAPDSDRGGACAGRDDRHPPD